jgi:hypothetical protein
MNWLRSFTVARQSDMVLCHVWSDGGSVCPMNTAIRVPLNGGGSHPSVADYVNVSLDHLREHHPKEYAEQMGNVS